MAQICASRMYFGLRVRYSEIKVGSFWWFLDCWLPWFHRLRSVLPWLKKKKIKPFESSVEWDFFVIHRWRRWRRYVPVACVLALRVRYSEIKDGSFWWFLDCWLPWFHRLRSVLPWLKKKKIKPFEISVEWDFFVIHRWRRWRRYVPVVCISALRVRYSEIKVGSFWRFLDG